MNRTSRRNKLLLITGNAMAGVVALAGRELLHQAQGQRPDHPPHQRPNPAGLTSGQIKLALMQVVASHAGEHHVTGPVADVAFRGRGYEHAIDIPGTAAWPASFPTPGRTAASMSGCA